MIDMDWGAFNPPHRFLMAWRITPEWQFQPDFEKCSQVEPRFTLGDDGTTLVELEHRGMERHGTGCDKMRNDVDSEGGWGSLMAMFAAKVKESE